MTGGCGGSKPISSRSSNSKPYTPSPKPTFNQRPTGSAGSTRASSFGMPKVKSSIRFGSK